MLFSVQKIFAHSIYFIFDKGEKSSTKIYLYDSLDKITRGDIGFINHVYETTLKQTKYFEISSEASYYKDKHIYYIVLYDIATTYSDAIYVLNSLNYLPFGEEISYKTYFNLDLNFYFIIQKSYSTYLHYQTNAISGHFSDTYDLKIINNNGDILVEQNKVGFNGYLKIESNVKYYVHMLIKYANIGDNSQFILNFEKYKENNILEEGIQKVKRVLYPQYYTFFKKISNLYINESLIFKAFVPYSDFNINRFFIKYYESDNFENLVNYFPGNRQDFDMEIGSTYINRNFEYELKKKYNSQKGVLFGVFCDDNSYTPFYWAMGPTYVFVSIEKKEDKDDKNESDENNKKDEESSFNIGLFFYIIINIIVVIAIIYYCSKYKNCCAQSYSSNNKNDSNYVYDKGSCDCCDVCDC